MQSIESKIEESIQARPAGSVFVPGDFKDYGSSDAVRKALDRLQDKQCIVRISHGIYARTIKSKYIGSVLPSVEQVAEAIAHRDRVRILPSGSYALNALGLSTQVPMKIVLLTDGSPRSLKIGKHTITFKKTTPKNLLARGKISRLVIQALKAIGNGFVSPEEERRIIELLKEESVTDLKFDISTAPVWIQKIMNKALVNESE
ncbi:MAG: hypothetical protein GX602_05440 [Dehalococcoidales bacterium]|jgi:hypothetical protein|nr:hypothetical protein [Dehalococcoidales bacterium]